jgi:endonuclease/exonuclease/phosphatase (EEP) superfamily protein YafD
VRVRNPNNPQVQMGAHGYRANWDRLGERPTLSSVTIDYVWSAGLTPTSQVVGSDSFGSDHSYVEVTFTLA